MFKLLLIAACLPVLSCRYNLDRTWPDASVADLAATDQADSRLIQFPDKRPPADRHPVDKRPPDRPAPRQ